MLKLSYIMGVYNGAETIMVPLNSIYIQGMDESEFEVIIVDDCSTDNTVQVVREFGKLHHNIKLICRNENHRLGAVRNVGVANARGKYLQFIDADDEIGKDVVAALDNAIKCDADVQKNGCSVQSQEMVWEYIGVTNKPYTNFCEEIFTTAPDFGGTCFYLWKSEFIKKYNRHFEEDVKMEDTDWVEFYLANANKIACFEGETYRYFYSPASITNTVSITSLTDMTLQCHRRLIVADTYTKSLPNFSANIRQACLYRVNNMLRYRNLTKFANSDYHVIYERISPDTRETLLHYNLSPFAEMVLRKKRFTLAVLYATAWISRVGRHFVHGLRRILK